MSISVEKLENFIVKAQPDLETIKRDLNYFNIFTVLGIQHREIRHSNFLGWLFDPNESHQLGDVFLKDLFKLIRNTNAIDAHVFVSLLLQDLSATQVYRESVHNIDILIVNEKLGFVVCIENKINADFSDHQLEKYYTYVTENYKELPFRIYLTLTPFKNENHLNFTAGDNYKNISYQNVVDIIKSKKEIIDTVISTVKESINQYVSMVEKSILYSSKEVELAQEIYKKYRNEIDFIMRHRPDFLVNRDAIVDCINKGSLGDFEIIPNENHKDLIRILPKDEKLKTIFKDERFNSWTGEYMFCLELFISKNVIWLKWCFGDVRNDEDMINLLQKRAEMVLAMKDFDCFKTKPLKIDLHKANPDDAYPGICGVHISTYDEYLNQDKDFIEYFSTKFKELDHKLIQPWISECKEKLNNL